MVAVPPRGTPDHGARRPRNPGTAALVAVIAHGALGFEWTTAAILGAALAPTDPAVMFSVLGNREIRGRSGTILEGESGVNDPVAIALVIGIVEYATHGDATAWTIVGELAVASRAAPSSSGRDEIYVLGREEREATFRRLFEGGSRLHPVGRADAE